MNAACGKVAFRQLWTTIEKVKQVHAHSPRLLKKGDLCKKCLTWWILQPYFGVMFDIGDDSRQSLQIHPDSWDEQYIYLHEWLTLSVNGGKHTIPGSYEITFKWFSTFSQVNCNHTLDFV